MSGAEPDPDLVARAHRLLAPRVAYLVGTKDGRGELNVIPVTNVTSTSVDPQHIVMAVYKRWETYRTLMTAPGFTLSVPTIDDLRGVWRLGARYSHYPERPPSVKMAESGLIFDETSCRFGAVLRAGIGWMECRTIQRLDILGDHGVFFGEVERVWFNPDFLTPDGVPLAETEPLMQVTGNLFTSPGGTTRIPYYNEP